jgi:hypothetical protein
MSTDEPIEERESSSPVCCLDLDRVPPTAPERERSIQGPSSPVETSGPVAEASADTVPPSPFMGASATDPPAASVAAPHLRFAVACTVDDCDPVSNKARVDAAAEPVACEKPGRDG